MTEITESRFNMWRAIVALAHADNIVVPGERHMIDKYLANAPFTPEQKEILLADFDEAQDIARLFDAITERADQGEFFEFARMMLWSDGDYAAQEEKLFSYLKDTQMARIGQHNIEGLMKETRDSQKLRKLKEEAALEQLADKTVGLGAFMKFWTGRA